jgi:hypothetical protein
VWGSGRIVQSFSTSALDGDEWSASRPSCSTLRERDPGTRWILGGWVIHVTSRSLDAEIHALVSLTKYTSLHVLFIIISMVHNHFSFLAFIFM